VRHEASIGYSTCFWWNVKTSLALFDRDGWLAKLKARAERPYPKPLVKAIIAKNHPLLRRNASSYLHQLEAAASRNDVVAVNHRLAALLASYFDILFAVNRVPHPGEKRLLSYVHQLCPRIPRNWGQHIRRVLAAGLPPLDSRRLSRAVNALVDGLDGLLASERLMPSE